MERENNVVVVFYVVDLMVDHYRLYHQGLYGSWKTWKAVEFYFDIFQDWKVLEKDYGSWKVQEICLVEQ